MSNKKISQTDAVNNEVVEDIIDLDLSVTRKKRFRFDKDNNRIVELNTSDMNILARMSEAYPKLTEQQKKAANLMEGIEIKDEDVDNENLVKEVATISERLKAIDQEMRDLIDFMFNAPVSDVAAPDGSMYDPYEGSFRFEYIITLLSKQYENNLQAEFNKMSKQMEKHTAKYTKGR
jgi:hypothetical protein